MLAGKRALRVADLILKEVAFLLLEKVKDPRVRGVTVTGARLTDDLKTARVYYSVIGEKDLIKTAQAGLDSSNGFIKKELGKRLALRYVPTIAFVHDASLEGGVYMNNLFERLKRDE